MTEGKGDLLSGLEKLLALKQEAARRYQKRKKEVVDFDIRAAYDILQTSSEGDEMRLQSILNQLKK